MHRSNLIARFLADESGNEIVEYALVTAVFALGVGLGVAGLFASASSLASSNQNNFSSNLVTPP
jgi:Flp pilus assembly pilin Flp